MLSVYSSNLISHGVRVSSWYHACALWATLTVDWPVLHRRTPHGTVIVYIYVSDRHGPLLPAGWQPPGASAEAPAPEGCVPRISDGGPPDGDGRKTVQLGAAAGALRRGAADRGSAAFDRGRGLA